MLGRKYFALQQADNDTDNKLLINNNNDNDTDNKLLINNNNNNDTDNKLLINNNNRVVFSICSQTLMYALFYRSMLYLWVFQHNKCTFPLEGL